MIYALALFFSLLLTAALVPPLMRVARRIGMVDVPEARKVHCALIPRCGGIAIAIGALVPLYFLAPSKAFISGICLGSILILIEGVVDDLRGLGYRWKFAGQVLAATVTVYATNLHFVSFGKLIPGYPRLNCGLFGYPLTIFFLVATTNIINLSDGLDGLAGGICFLIFAATGFLAFIGRDFVTFALSMCMCGAIVGFLRYNTHPAVVFLGDAGSQFLGFMAGVTVLLFTGGGARHSPIVAMFMLGVPVFDTLLAIVRRAVQKRPLFKPDASHIHHKLLRLGLKHHQAVTVIYLAQLLIIMIGWTLCKHSTAILFGIYLGLLLLVTIVAIFPFRGLSERLERNRVRNGITHGENAEPGYRGLFSRKFVSMAAWIALSASLVLFFVLSPVWMRPIPPVIGYYALGFMLVLAIVMMVRRDYFVPVAKMAGYFMTIYYVMAFDFDSYFQGFWGYRDKWLLLSVFLLMGAGYLGFLIASLEELPIITIDYLLLGLVALTFLLPDPIKAEFHVNTIAAKVLLVFLSLELVSFRLGGQIELLAPAAFVFLGMCLMMAV